MSDSMAAISYLLSSKSALIATFLVFTGQALSYHTNYLVSGHCSFIRMGMVVIDVRMFSSKHIMIRKRDFERLC